MSSDGSTLEFHIISDLEQAKYYRNLLSPNETIYDLWDLRYCFFKYFVEYRIHFIVGFCNGEAIGVLPLHLNTVPKKYEDYCGGDQPYYEFFGSGWFQCNRILHRGHELNHAEKQLFYQQVIEDTNYPHCLHNICHEDHVFEEMKNNVDDYYYNLSSIPSDYDFVEMHFCGKQRKHMRKEINEIKILNLQSVITTDQKMLYKLFDYSIARFEKPSLLNIPSTFLRKHRKDIFIDLCRIADDEIKTMFYALCDENNDIKAVALLIGYQDQLYYANFGVDQTYNNLAKFLTIEVLTFAKQSGYNIFMAASGKAGSWKQKWHLSSISLYILSNISSNG